MSQLVRTRPIGQRADAVDDFDGGGGISASDVFDRVWRTFTSMRTALLLMLGLAVLALIGAILVQAPAGLSSDPQAYGAWLEALRPKYGGWVPVMDKLQLFTVFQSIWFKLIVVGLMTSVLACSANRFRGLWKTAVHPRTKMTGTFFDSAPHSAAVEADSDQADALDAARRVFRSKHFRTVVEADGDTVHLYAVRFRWAPFGTLLAHLSLVLILVGAMIGSLFGFRNSEFAAPVGSQVEVGAGTGLTLLARNFQDSYYSNGAPSDYASDIVLYRNGVQVAEQTVRVNQPLNYDGTTFYQSFFGPAASVHVTDAKGTVLHDGGVPLLWTSNDGNRKVGQFNLVDAGKTVFVVGAASGQVDPAIKAGEMQLEIYNTGSDQPVAVQVIDQGKPVTIDGLQYTFQREQQFTGLIVARDPGQLFVWLGALLLVGGLFLLFMFPNRRIWAQVRRRPDGGSEVRLGATARHDATFGPDFQNLVSELRLAFGQVASQEGA